MTAQRTSAAPGRIRRLRLLIQRPADAWLLCRMATWAAVLPLLKHVIRLETLARLMWTGGGSKDEADADKIVALSRLLTPPAAFSRGTCYERSLLAYRFLAQCGVDPRLVVSVRKEGASVTGHAWVTVGGLAIGESEAIEGLGFVPVVVYGRGGLPEE